MNVDMERDRRALKRRKRSFFDDQELDRERCLVLEDLVLRPTCQQPLGLCACVQSYTNVCILIVTY